MNDPTTGGDPSRPFPPPVPGASSTPVAPEGPSGEPTQAQAYPPPPMPGPPAAPAATPPPPPIGAGPLPSANPADAARKKPRRWLVPTIVGIVALLVGIGIGAASAQSTTEETKDELAAMTAERDDLRTQVDDRAAQTEADQAAAERVQAEKDEADRKAAEDQAAAEKAAADKAAADQAAADKAAADEAAASAAAEATRNTIPGSGIFEIGGDKSPGTYRTDGPAGSSVLGSCYYAVLSSPTGSGIDNIIDNNIISGPGIVTLQAGQYFETTGCAQWTRS